MIGWVYLLLAIGFEVAAATCMKLSDSLSRPWPSALMAIFYILCFLAMIKSLEHLQIGVVYAIWAGAGTAAIAIIGVMMFNDTMPWIKIARIMLIIGGVALVNLGGTNSDEPHEVVDYADAP